MADQTRRWLIAAWPGMGNVAVIAAGYLIQQLRLRPVAELPPRGHFDVQHVEVKDGVVARPRLPRSVFYGRASVPGAADLLVLLAESQPTSGSFAYAHELLDRAKELGAERIVTFASMASQLHPSDEPTVYGVSTDAATFAELERYDVEPLKEGQIAGLNGLLLGAAAEREMNGLCLLGEIPFFAAAVPNPKAAKAVLEVFSAMSDLKIDLDELSRHAETVDRALIQMLERMKEHAQEEGELSSLLPEEEDEEETAEPAPPTQSPTEKPLDLAARHRIERLFEEARRDRSKAVRLKEELDRLGVYAQYEDRFLDLFRRAE